jgi:hypothetical protein
VRGERSSWRGSGRAVGGTRQWRGGGLGHCVAAVPDQRPVALLTCAQAVMSPRRAVAADAMASCVPQQANHPGRWRALDAKTRPGMAGHGGERRRTRAQRLWAKRPQAFRPPAMCDPEPYGVSNGGMPAAQPRAIRPFVRPTTPSARCHNTWRQRVARLGRDAWSCSKTLAHYMGAIKRCMCHDNLTRAAASRAHDMECTTTIALCFCDLGIYQLDDRHRSSIAGSVSEAQNSGVTTLSSGKPWGDFIEQLLHDSIALHHLEGLAACMEVPTLA